MYIFLIDKSFFIKSKIKSIYFKWNDWMDFCEILYLELYLRAFTFVIWNSNYLLWYNKIYAIVEVNNKFKIYIFMRIK